MSRGHSCDSMAIDLSWPAAAARTGSCCCPAVAVVVAVTRVSAVASGTCNVLRNRRPPHTATPNIIL